MTAPIPRLRMFAGPNGSGKSTIKDMLPSGWLGVYVNADEIEKAIRLDGGLNLPDFEVNAAVAEFQAFFKGSTLLAKAGLLFQAQQLTLSEGRVVFGAVEVNSYFASGCGACLDCRGDRWARNRNEDRCNACLVQYRVVGHLRVNARRVTR